MIRWMVPVAAAATLAVAVPPAAAQDRSKGAAERALRAKVRSACNAEARRAGIRCIRVRAKCGEIAPRQGRVTAYRNCDGSARYSNGRLDRWKAVLEVKGGRYRVTRFKKQ